MSEHDISVEEVQRDTTLKEKKLLDMKKKIQAMKLNFNKDKTQQPHKHQNNRQPLTITQHISSENHHHQQTYNHQGYQQNQGYQHNPPDIQYNSTLFKQIGNESQPLINNASGVSNFSSVSNINQILNAHHHQPQNQPPSFYPASTYTHSDDNLMQSIDQVLSKVKKSQNLPTKALQKILDKQKHSKSIMPQQQFTMSKLANSSSQLSVRKKLQQYKKFIDKLDTIEQEKPNRQHKADFYKNKPQNHEQSPSYFNASELSQQQITTFRTHQKEPSGLTPRSEYPSQDSNHPPLPHKKQPNTVQRQMLKIKSSMQQIKRLETQSSHQMVDMSIDFQLSDEQHQQKDNKNDRINQLLKEKKELQFELEDINKELQILQTKL